MLERLICILIGYVFGLFQTSYIIGKYTKQISVSMEAEMRAQRMRCVPLEKKPEQ